MASRWEKKSKIIIKLIYLNFRFRFSLFVFRRSFSISLARAIFIAKVTNNCVYGLHLICLQRSYCCLSGFLRFFLISAFVNYYVDFNVSDLRYCDLLLTIKLFSNESRRAYIIFDSRFHDGT